MADYRKLIIALVIAVLFAIFVHTSIQAVKAAPQYDDYCDYSIYKYSENMTDVERAEIDAQSRACSDAYQVAQEEYNFIVFVVSAIAGLIAIIIGLFIPVQNPVGMAIASGLLLGGLFTLFFGTIDGWSGIARTVRPFIILAEMIVVIVVAYKKLGTSPVLPATKKKR